MNEWFKKVVDERGLTLSEVAEGAALAEKTVRAYYNGSKRIGRKTTCNLLKTLDLSEEDVDDLEAVYKVPWWEEGNNDNH